MSEVFINPVKRYLLYIYIFVEVHIETTQVSVLSGKLQDVKRVRPVTTFHVTCTLKVWTDRIQDPEVAFETLAKFDTVLI